MYEMDKFSIIKGIHKTLNDKIIKTIQINTSYNTIPNFIIYYDKKLLNSKINELIKHQFLFNYTDKNQSKIEYKYLMKYFPSFFKNPNIIFNKDIFSDEFRIKIFKLIILCNYKYLKRNKNAYDLFKERIVNNIIIMKLDKYCKELNEEFDTIMKKEEKIIEEELLKLKSEVKNELFPEKDELNKKDVINNIENDVFKLNKKYLKLIFSLSALFNRIIIIKNKNIENKKEIEENINNINENKMENNKINDNIIINDIQYEIKIISKLKCSSIYRQFLLNILNIFEEENVFIYNYMLESYIFSDIIKIDTRLLFQKTRAKEKIIFSYTDILEKIRQKETIQSLFNTFYNENKSIFIQPVINIGFFGNLFNKKIPTSIKSGKGFEIYYNLNELKLMPIIRGEIYSTQITIVIDGPLSTDIQLISNDTILSHKEIFSSFFTNNIYTNSDFYLYDWQSINYKELSNIKKVSKFYGKLLAYIIASRDIFTFQTINLVGYGFGCNVIKYCLIELNKINKKMNCFDIINNVVFIGGCVHLKLDKNSDIFEGVAGKIVNIFSKNDLELINYNKDAIGLKEIEIPKKLNGKYQIVNYDLSKKNVKQDDFLYNIPDIFFQNTFLH